MIGDFLRAISRAALEAAASSLLNSPSRPRDEGFVKVRWANAMLVTMPMDRCQQQMREFFGKFAGYRLLAQTDEYQLFARGDRSITRLPTTRGVAWCEVPLSVYVDYSMSDGRTKIAISYLSHDGVEFDQACVEFFHEQAEYEYDRAFKGIGAAAERYQRSRARPRPASGQQHAGNPASDPVDHGHVEQTARDLALLGLKPPTTLALIQAAYREACHKYHPDRLSSAPKHLVELAVDQFKRMSDAYQRLKRQYS